MSEKPIMETKIIQKLKWADTNQEWEAEAARLSAQLQNANTHNQSKRNN